MRDSRLSHSRRVLIADGLADRCDALRVLLTLWGHKVTVASDGPAALATAATFRPDAALLDLDLPGLDGFAVARRLRRSRALDGVLLLAVTATDTALERARCRAAGFDRRLVVPFDPEELRTLLERGTVQPLRA